MLQSNDSLLDENNISSIFKFSELYSSIHGWLSIVVCSIGVIMNTINIFILKQARLVSYTTNLILCLIALFDSLVMLMYIPFCIHYYILFKNTNGIILERDTLFWTVYSIMNTFVSITFHSISIWSTVYLAFFRYITIKESTLRFKSIDNNQSFTKKILDHFLSNSKTYLFINILFCILICTPIYMATAVKHEIYIQNRTLGENKTIESSIYVYFIGQSDLNKSTGELLFKLSFYFQAIFVKIVPCILLTIFISLILMAISGIEKNKKRLRTSTSKLFESKSNIYKMTKKEKREAEIKESASSNEAKNFLPQQETKYEQQFKSVLRNSIRRTKKIAFNEARSNYTLILVCVLFLIAEFPQSILIFISIFSDEFYINVYKLLGDFLDALVLINYSINFSLYCSMSKNFRNSFRSFFKILKSRK